VNGPPIFPGYTNEVRDASRVFLSNTRTPDAFGKLTPVEEAVLFKFGGTMLYILRKVLAQWAVAMWEQVSSYSDFTGIREVEHVNLIMKHLKRFHDLYEQKFGKIEKDTSLSSLGRIKDDTVYIKCIGYGVKVVLGLLMADRMHVIQAQRQSFKERTGFLEINPKSLDIEHSDCPICQDPMGVESPEEKTETPIKLVICCQQIMGKQCLKTWLGELLYSNKFVDSCPTCRYRFPEPFLEKLYGNEGLIARIKVERMDDLIDLESPPPEPEFEAQELQYFAPYGRSQQEQDAQLQRQIGEAGGVWNGDARDVEEDLIQFNPRPVTIPRRLIIRYDRTRQVELREIVEDDFVMEG
jgi:hypothetical protein